jgi:hypothetical protein
MPSCSLSAATITGIPRGEFAARGLGEPIGAHVFVGTDHSFDEKAVSF